MVHCSITMVPNSRRYQNSIQHFSLVRMSLSGGLPFQTLPPHGMIQRSVGGNVTLKVN